MSTSVNSWEDAFKRLARRALSQQASASLWQKYQGLLTAHYQTLVSPRHALNDLLQLERLLKTNVDCISLLKPHAGQLYYRLHFYSLKSCYLDEFMPVLENLYLRVIDQVQFTFDLETQVVTIKSFTVAPVTHHVVPFQQLKNRLLDTLQAMLARQVENDALNKLCILTGMHWQEIDVLRAYRNYYLQLGHAVSKESFHQALINYPAVALDLFRYFEVRFRPEPAWEEPLLREEQALAPLRLQLLTNIDAVVDLNADRILRTVFNLIDATVRSNFHRRRTLSDYFIAFKINSLGVIELPNPKPQYEIYVHAVDMEGIHLRSGKVSRGGIRWSDRLDDFRTEILGLMQTQISKNSLIIPTGAKGGFVVKGHYHDQAFKDAGKQAYIKLIRGMLDLTDNYQEGAIVTPQGIVTHDDPDPYLVVAADKGTAKFSDIANAIAAEYRFWLDDAFASGGSRGYDHKALGITARGAWACAKRHFLEIGKDIQQEAFTVIGVGSMDGDVFGNGMLLSPCIRLLAAFSGQHIFIDPNPLDNNAPFMERKRLFELAGSTWHDYDHTLISKGGGVYLRADKSIPVSTELKKWLGIRYKAIDGESLIRYLLTAPIELLWLGGIGCYIKASTEKHEDVGDRSNDNVRVNASELAAKVVGEGANLGFTQKARIEYSLLGGRINTDAVDNSAGVDTSDHEVNLKILLTALNKQGLIADQQTLFVAMTDTVCQLVLADNIAQSLCLSLEILRSAGENAGAFLQVADRLEAAGFLDRAVDVFAQAKDIQARPGHCLARPELANLMAASKRYLTQQLQNQPGFLQDACYDEYCLAYFPEQLSQYKQHLIQHPLANEIKATVISNKIINQAGSCFLGQAAEHENGSFLAAVDCYLAFEQILNADTLRHSITALPHPVTVEQQYQLLLQLDQVLMIFCRWAITHDYPIRPDPQTINRYRQYWQDYVAYCQAHPIETWQTQVTDYQQAGLPLALAQLLALIRYGRDFPFMVLLAHQTQQPFTNILASLEDIQHALGLREIQQQLINRPLQDHWERTVAADLQTELQQLAGQLLNNLLSCQRNSCADYLQHETKPQQLGRYRQLYQQWQSTPQPGLLPYVALITALESLVLNR